VLFSRPYSTRPAPYKRARRRPLSQGARQFLASADPSAPPARELALDEARALLREMMVMLDQPGPSVGAVEDAPATGPAPPMRIYRPRSRPRGAIVFLHGGGWTLGDIDAYDGFARRLCASTDRIVINVDYSLSPEAKFPTALEQTGEALAVAIRLAASEGLGAERVALAGDSAGGTLAAAAALRHHNNQGPALGHMALFYPVMLIEHDPAHGSREALGDGRYFLAKADIDWAAGNYLERPEDACRAEVSPLLATDMSAFPPTTVITAGYDPLRDEGADFVRRLNAAGADAQLYCFDGALHGFMGFSKAMSEAAVAFKLVSRRLR